jgi:uncharacterized cupin superfamily protein
MEMDTQASPTVVKLPIAAAPDEPGPIPPEDVVAGDPKAAVAILWRNDEGTLFNGVWHCTPGSFYLDHADETVAFISGRATVTPQGGEPVEIEAGDTAFFPDGTRVPWEVHETVRKAFHNHDPSGRLLGAG